LIDWIDMASAVPTPRSRTVLVTGATSGLGFETVRRLAATDATVIMHSPTDQHGEEALKRLVKGGADPVRLHLAVADFSRLAQVHALAERIAGEHARLDVLVNNAATISERRVTTEDGNELTFQVNYLAPYLLTRRLRGPLTAVPGSRVVNVSSSLHRMGSMHWGDLMFAQRYAPVAAYARAKLALTMFTKALAEYGSSGPSAVAMHPGVLETALMRRVYGRIGGPVGEGAAALLHLCEPSTPVDNGGYYNRMTRAHASPLVANRRALGRLWKISVRLCGLEKY
jgi:NAD(P)-dependent dehydrogenase (short-subunit alcohol dehydrogenase family)